MLPPRLAPLDLEKLSFRVHSRLSAALVSVLPEEARLAVQVLLILICAACIASFLALHLIFVRNSSCMQERIRAALAGAESDAPAFVMRVRLVPDAPQAAAWDCVFDDVRRAGAWELLQGSSANGLHSSGGDSGESGRNASATAAMSASGSVAAAAGSGDAAVFSGSRSPMDGPPPERLRECLSALQPSEIELATWRAVARVAAERAAAFVSTSLKARCAGGGCADARAQAASASPAPSCAFAAPAPPSLWALSRPG